jgi:thiamine-monophosphate kinase
VIANAAMPGSGRGDPVLYSDFALHLTEKALIARVRRKARNRPPIVAGIGDDCAILRIPQGHEAIVTTDFSLEGVHFRRQWHPAESVGHRCLVRGLSDVAAMGGEPIAAFLSMAVPRKLPQKWVGQFLQGFLKLADRFGVSLAGGDTAESPDGILADIVVVGSCPKGRAIRRSGAIPGDSIYVTGKLGGSEAALQRMFAKPKGRLNHTDFPRHFFPEPRIRAGTILREKRLASAMIDLSDGLSTDLAHICEESGVGAEIDSEKLPRARVGKAKRAVSLNLALHGGEDYELLFTASAHTKIPARLGAVAVTRIGQITARKKIYVVRQGEREELKPQGWEHFR